MKSLFRFLLGISLAATASAQLTPVQLRPATAAQVAAGTDNSTYITPLTLSGAGVGNAAITQVAYLSPNGNDSTAALNSAGRPWATLTALLTANTEAAVPYLVIQMAVGTYVAPPDDNLNGGVGSLMRSNVAFIGSGSGFFNAGSTAITGGTIIQGEMMMGNRSNVVMEHLNNDCGLTVCNALYSGVGVDCIGFYNTGSVVSTPQTTGIVVDDVVCLGLSPSALFHCLLIENTDRAQVRNVKLRYNTHGLICKATNSNFSNIISEGHNLDGAIIKGDNYASCQNDTFTGLVCASVNPAAYDGAGLEIQGESAPVSGISVTGFSAQHVKYGLLMSDTTGAIITDVYVQANIYDSQTFIATLAGNPGIFDIIGDTAAANGILTVSDTVDYIILRSPILLNTVTGITVSGVNLEAIMPTTKVTGTAYSRTSGTFNLVNPTFLNVPTTKYSGTLQVNDLSTLTPASSWANVGSGNSTLRAIFNGSQVTMSGLISGGTQTSGTTITTLPVGLRPLSTVTVSAQCSAAGVWSAIPITISTAGVVALGAAAPGNTGLSFDGVVFNAF